MPFVANRSLLPIKGMQLEIAILPVMLLSGGEVSIAMNGMIDYGFSNLTDLEWVVSRVSQTASIPLIADIEDGFGGPLAVYRSAKGMAAGWGDSIGSHEAVVRPWIQMCLHALLLEGGHGRHVGTWLGK